MFGDHYASRFNAEPDLQPIKPASFVMCPTGLSHVSAVAQCAVQQHIYRLAFEQAQAVAQPRRFDPELVFAAN